MQNSDSRRGKPRYFSFATKAPFFLLLLWEPDFRELPLKSKSMRGGSSQRTDDEATSNVRHNDNLFSKGNYIDVSIRKMSKLKSKESPKARVCKYLHIFITLQIVFTLIDFNCAAGTIDRMYQIIERL